MAASPHKDAFLVPAYSDFIVWEAGIFYQARRKMCGKYIRKSNAKGKTPTAKNNSDGMLGTD